MVKKELKAPVVGKLMELGVRAVVEPVESALESDHIFYIYVLFYLSKNNITV